MSELGLVSFFSLIQEDNDVVGSRAHKAVIRKAGDLTTDEKFCLGDLLQEYGCMPGNAPDLCKSELYKSFFDEVFKFWTSAHAVSQGPVLPPRDPSQSCIEIDDSWAEMTLSDQVPGMHVSLTMEFDREKETFAWIWRGHIEEPLTLEDLKYHLPDGVTMNEAIVAAIGHYDDIERERVTSHNRRKIINMARRRIRNFALAVTSDNIEHLSYDRIQEGEILPLILARDVYLKNTRFANEIVAAIERDLDMTPI
ncbi:hypothetical protein N0V84_008626 [Fusarium piperis]|uniref:Uncharacterized protein n=1 Tax=Fusarium piperis TaxID=1435070 RepID=A0A9W8W7R5_9HYPO|nr:hypothetical protein N0V84_008626 [Fusarium piperis]